jgi:uncharacterized membrane protein (DUF106 family)
MTSNSKQDAISEAKDSYLNVLLEEGEQNDIIEWKDVSDRVSTGFWGRMIECGVLDEKGSGFHISNRSNIEQQVSDDTEVHSDINVDVSWDKKDKIAAVASAILALGYSVEFIQQLIMLLLDPIFSTILTNSNMVVVTVVISIITASWASIARYKRIDADKMSQLKEKISQRDMDDMGDGTEQLDMMKLNFKPLAWISLLTIPMFIWMYVKFGVRGNTGVELASVMFPLLGTYEWTSGLIIVPIVGFKIQTWLVWYLFCSIGFNQIIPKLFGIKV